MKFAFLFAVMALVFLTVSCGSSSSATDNANNQGDEDTTVIDNSADKDSAAADDKTTTEADAAANEADVIVNDVIQNEDTTDVLADDGDTTEVPDEAGNPEIILKKKFVGTWAERLILKATTKTTGVSAESTTTRYKIGVVTLEGKELKISHTICKIDSTSTIGNPVFPQKYCETYWFWRSNELQTPKEDITVTDNAGTVTFVENRTWELRGMQKMTNVETDAMPTAKTDARIIDHDGDGNPGFTMSVSGMGAFYFVQRLSQELTSTAVTDTKITGGVSWTDAQYVIDSPNITLKGQRTTETHNDQSTFTYVKVAATMTCTEVYAQKDTLFN